MKSYPAFLFLILFFTACNSPKKNNDSEQINKTALIAADNAFSKMSEEKGMKNAFIEFIDSNGVLLKPNHLPIMGANAIDYLIQQNDSAYTLTWEPYYADVANSGEMGYTYGIYELRPKSKDTIIYGSYTSIWKKQNDGKWKFVLDTGNEGISNE